MATDHQGRGHQGGTKLVQNRHYGGILMKRIVLIAGGLCFASLAFAQAFPSRPVTLIVPFTTGTGIDILARGIGPKLSERWKQPVVVENKPGASGNIGTDI